LSGRPPFYDEHPENVLRKIKAGCFDFPTLEWDYVSMEGSHFSFSFFFSPKKNNSFIPLAKDLISLCLTTNPDERIGIYEFLSHKWMRVKFFF